MFTEVSISVFVQSSWLEVEKVVNHELVDISLQLLVLRVLVNSESCELFNSLQYFIFIIDCLNSVEPTSLRLVVLIDLEDDSVGFREAFVRLNIVVS